MRTMLNSEISSVAGGDITAGDVGGAVGGAVGGILGGIWGASAGALAGKAVGEFFGCESTANACNTDLNMGHVNLTM